MKTVGTKMEGRDEPLNSSRFHLEASIPHENTADTHQEDTVSGWRQGVLKTETT